MGFRLNIPLPGPFSYSGRIGGRRRRGTQPAAGLGCFAVFALFTVGAVGAFFQNPTFWGGALALFLVALIVIPFGAAILDRIAKARARRAAARAPMLPAVRAAHERQVEAEFAKLLRDATPERRPHLERARQQWRDQRSGL